MRPLEILQLALVAAAVFVPVGLGKRLRRGRVATALIVVMVVQLLFEGFRWQLVFLELATVALAVEDALWDERRVRGLPRVRRAALGFVGVVLVGLLPAAVPVPQLPEPAGRFAIGTQTFVLEDPERTEMYGLPEPEEDEEVDAPRVRTPNAEEEVEEPGEPRRIVVQVWYPAEPADGDEPGLWNPDIDVVGPALADRSGFPAFLLSHVDEVSSHSVEGATPMDGKFPVVLSSHGWTGFRTINLNQVESLTSRGFVVIAPDHAYGAIASRFPDDSSVVYLDERALPDHETTPEDDYDEASEQLVETFSDDLILILDALEQGATGPFGQLADHADLKAIGAYGHSTGGGAAVRTCLVDPRCDAVLGMDPWVEPITDRVVASELRIPSLFMRSDEWRGTPNDARLRGQAERSPSESYWVGIVGAGHSDFTVVPLFTPMGERLNLKGPIDAERVVPIIDTYLVSFFERYLLGVGGTGLDQPPPPEVEFEYIE